MWRCSGQAGHGTVLLTTIRLHWLLLGLPVPLLTRISANTANMCVSVSANTANKFCVCRSLQILPICFVWVSVNTANMLCVCLCKYCQYVVCVSLQILRICLCVCLCKYCQHVLCVCVSANTASMLCVWVSSFLPSQSFGFIFLRKIRKLYY